jgi:nucleotide-binding universal stress UspA family protein
MKILLAVDGSVSSLHMLAVLGAHAELLPNHHDCTALTVVEPMPGRMAAFLPAASIAAWYDDEAHGVLEPVSRFAKQQGWMLKTERAIGSAGEQIVRYATEGDFDLIVMGTHGRTALAGVVLGSVSTYVLGHCGIPLLLVPRPASEWTLVSPGAVAPGDPPEAAVRP